MLYHISEEPGITVFEPRAIRPGADPVVWAVAEKRLRNYLLPRDCPRIAYHAGPATTAADVGRFLGSSRCVVAFEEGWLDRVRSTRLYCYQFSPAGFDCIDTIAGYYTNPGTVIPRGVHPIDDLPSALVRRGVEVRTVPSLWPLHDAVLASTLEFSFIRLRNATARP
jgi:hypothetical protein